MKNKVNEIMTIINNILEKASTKEEKMQIIDNLILFIETILQEQGTERTEEPMQNL